MEKYVEFLTLLLAFVCLEEAMSLRYLSGDFLTNPRQKNHQGRYYPSEKVTKFVDSELQLRRRGRAMQFVSVPQNVRKTLSEWGDSTLDVQPNWSKRRSNSTSEDVIPDGSMCRTPSSVQRLCQTTYNTTAPMFGMSLTSGKNVTIVQKFPDLLQQVTSEVCASSECDVIHGDCVQTYMPHLFLVIPLGPVTLTGQDYILVESGCVCRPKFALPTSDHDPRGN